MGVSWPWRARRDSEMEAGAPWQRIMGDLDYYLSCTLSLRRMKLIDISHFCLMKADRANYYRVTLLLVVHRYSGDPLYHLAGSRV
jgi:hypothetical protein